MDAATAERIAFESLPDFSDHLQDVSLPVDLATAQQLTVAAELREDTSGTHPERVGYLSGQIARALGADEEAVERIEIAAALHDIGKIVVPDSVLLKEGPLSEEEYALVRKHTAIGARLLSGSDSPLLQLAASIAFTHHEWWDGSGYEGLEGDQIPLEGRIVGLADVFDTLTHARAYKAAWPLETAIDEIVDRKGTQFDPQVVEAFLRVLQV